MSSIFNGNSVSALSDTVITSVADNEVLTYDSATGMWINDTASVATLSVIDNVDITGTVKGDILVYDGFNWVDVTVGANDEVLTADSAETSGVKWAAAAGGGGGDPLMMEPISQTDVSDIGTSINPGGIEATSTYNFLSAFGATAGQIIWWPAYVSKTTTYNDISMEITTAATSGRVGELILYNIGSDGLPSTPAVESGSIALDSTGVKTIAIDTSITAGWYYIAFLWDNGNSGVADGAMRVNGILDGATVKNFMQPGTPATTYTGFKKSSSYTVGNAPDNPTSLSKITTNPVLCFLEVD